MQVEETTEGIDYSRLKQQEKIYFYDDVILYEDELADNGTALLSAKIVSVSLSLMTWISRSSVVLCTCAACDGLRVLCPPAFFPEGGWGCSKNERHQNLPPGQCVTPCLLGAMVTHIPAGWH